MTGSLAETIMGEAGPDPAAQFAVATTIYNRQKAGNFPGGTDLRGIVNAPQQYVGYNPSPNASAQALAAAIESGTLDHYGTVGNAVNFQSGATAQANGLTAGTNIGGNWFSDRFGAPTSDFQAPVFGGAAGVLGDPNAVHAPTTPTSGGSSSTTPPGSGQQVALGLQKTTLDSIQTWINGIAKGVWDSVWKTVGGTLLDFQNWFVRAFVIIVGIVVLAIGLIKLSGHNVSDVIVAGGKAVAMA